MQHEQDQTHNQDDVNETGGYVKCEKPKQPENDQNCSDYPKHVYLRVSDHEPIRDRVLPTCRLVRARREFCNIVDTSDQIFLDALIGRRGRIWINTPRAPSFAPAKGGAFASGDLCGSWKLVRPERSSDVRKQ
jgi:hypothetical protein